MNKLNLIILLLLMSGNTLQAQYVLAENTLQADNKDIQKYIKAKQYQSRTQCLLIKNVSLKRVCLHELRR